MTSRAIIFASPALCIGLLSVIAVDSARHLRPQDAAPYHLRAKIAVEAFPYIIGYWTGADEALPDAAVKLLRPNAVVSRRYANHSPQTNGPTWADLLIVQCADSRDMTGHYPPICYPSSGEPQISRRPFQIMAGDRMITGVEYQFIARRDPRTDIERKSVYNFFVVPGRGIVADIGGVRRAAGESERRCFGAAQFQVVMDADNSPESRNAVFATLIGSDTAVLRALEAAR